MVTKEIIRLLNNRLAYQHNQRLQAEQRGDIASINLIDADIAETERALLALQEV
jgi:hypothetical protein